MSDQVDSKTETKQDLVGGQSEAAETGRNYEKLFLDAARREKELREQLSQIAAKQKEAAEAEERKKLEEQGKYQEIVKQRDAELAAIKEQHAKERLNDSIDRALLQAGAMNQIFRKGAVANYDGSVPIDEYIKKLSDENPDLFGVSIAGNPAPSGVKPSTRSQTKSLDERLISDDPLIRAQARQEKFNSVVGS